MALISHHEDIGYLLTKLSLQRPQFFLRLKSNDEWEAGWGNIAGPLTVRANTLYGALRCLDEKDQKPK